MCYQVDNYPCTYYSSRFTSSCKSNNVIFCCLPNVDFCGNMSGCLIKPGYYTICYFILYVIWGCYGTSWLLAFFVFVLFRKYRQKVSGNQYLIMQ